MFAQRVSGITPFLVMEILERAKEMERAGEHVVHLEVGEPDFDTPACICDAAKLALGQGFTHYTHSLGDQDLREEVSAHFQRRYGVKVSPGRVLVFSGTSILLFLSLYYIIDERLPQISMYWEKYQDVVLLVFIVLSVFLTSWLDVVLVKLTHLDPEQKASVRLISVFYIVLILLYIRFIYEDTNYDGLILYFLTLTVGRFLYFDFTVKSFLETMRGVLENLPLLVIMSAYSGFVCWYGFHVGFLLKSNGVILSTFLAHLFMDCSIFLLHKTGILKHVIRKI